MSEVIAKQITHLWCSGKLHQQFARKIHSLKKLKPDTKNLSHSAFFLKLFSTLKSKKLHFIEIVFVIYSVTSRKIQGGKLFFKSSKTRYKLRNKLALCNQFCIVLKKRFCTVFSRQKQVECQLFNQHFYRLNRFKKSCFFAIQFSIFKCYFENDLL